MPSSDLQWYKYSGVLSIVSAPSDSLLAYMAYYNGIYKSTDRGDHWVSTNFPTMSMTPNDDNSKLSGERLAVDPLNENIVYFGSINDGLWRTLDGGNNWENIVGIPNGTANRGVRQIVFDTSQGNVNNATTHIYVMVDGDGAYLSTDAGGSWTNIQGNFNAPVFLDAAIDALGNFYVVGNNGNGATFGIKRYNSGTWTTIQSNGTIFLNVATDPFNPDRVLALSNGFTTTAITENALSATPTWSYPTTQRTSPNIPWLSWTEGNWFTIGEVFFDPLVQNKVWISEGVGVWNIESVNTTNNTWVENSKGQEHLVSNDLVVNKSGQPITAHWDRSIFLHTNIDQYPLTHKTSNRFNSAWDMDISPADSNFVAAIIEDHRYCCYDSQHRNSSYSLDGGNTWTKFSTMPDPTNTNSIFGNIAVSANSIDNIVWLPTQNMSPYYTLNRGQTWQQVTLPNDNGNCCLNFHFVYKKALTADRVLPATFYIYNWQNGSIYVTSDGGATWTEKTALQDYWGWHAKIQSVVGYAGHLWYSHGDEDAISLITPLKRTTDGGDTWQTLSNTAQVLNHTLGAPYPGSAYPTVYIQGRVGGEYGYWMSLDEGASWTKIGDYPEGIYDRAKVMEADPYIPGRLYVGFGGNGFVYREGCLIEPPVLAVNQNVCPANTGSFEVTTPCGAGSHIEYSTDGGSTWTTTLPAWADGVTLMAKCVDDTDIACESTAVSVTATQTACCGLSNVTVITQCDDAGTPGDTSDDTFTVTLNPVGENVADTYSVSGDITSSNIPYGSPQQIGGNYTVNNGNLSVLLVDDATPSCTLDLIIPPAMCNGNCPPISPIQICDDGTDSVRLTADIGTSNVVWFNGSNVQVSTGAQLIIDSTTLGMDDGNESYYYTADDTNGCPALLCCPVFIETKNCCPATQCVGVTVMKE